MGARLETKGAGMVFSGRVNLKTDKVEWTRKTPAEDRDLGEKSLQVEQSCKHCKSKPKAGQCHCSQAARTDGEYYITSGCDRMRFGSGRNCHQLENPAANYADDANFSFSFALKKMVKSSRCTVEN